MAVCWYTLSLAMRLGQRALVIGASMGGLLAARVLSDHVGEVIVCERDLFPTEVGDRKGVPQGRHAHALLSSGRQTLEDLFPGFTGELSARGALAADIAGLRWFDNGGYHARCTGIQALLVSRALLETHVRARVRGLPNVRLIDRRDVDSLIFTADSSRVTGVRTQQSAGGAKEDLAADLVVDACGRG